ncbi:nitronate monooxygenase [Streptomyces sp. NPDC002835]
MFLLPTGRLSPALPESGGFCGDVCTMALVPQVVDAVRPLPVLASGGIADGRGIAAAPALGAEGVNIGTRFLADAPAPGRGRVPTSTTTTPTSSARRSRAPAPRTTTTATGC